MADTITIPQMKRAKLMGATIEWLYADGVCEARRGDAIVYYINPDGTLNSGYVSDMQPPA